MATFTNFNLQLDDAIFQCKQTFENILSASTTTVLKKSILDKILIMLQEYIHRVKEIDKNESSKEIVNLFAKKLNLAKDQRELRIRHLTISKLYVTKRTHLVALQKWDSYKCAACNYQTPRKADLKKHLKRHMGVCDYCCNYCARTFFDKYNLERHVNANHTKQQQYSCTMCTYKTYLYDSLKRHTKIKHIEDTEQQFICPICFHVSATKQDMTIHSYVHNQTKPYMCEECGSMFAIKSRLKTHQNTVHNERLHTCCICEKSFQSMSLLKRHTMIHSRFKPYSCPFCNHSSNSQSNLTKHVRNIHSKANFSYHKFINGK
ncbi:oocyte zinc finger protein XlCOF19-like isoform X2 [Adelges cooleyi]|uniref:oocyte zinc finger protein XlCOF19-like isoform X2 n=1 Tax=Adelges cooleyi TaxID=133065 RepID=UPI0021809800|nr:oocyte zinc finger protein XlCOF19-like isoform X2 [Adelges cooleyi]